LRNSLIFGGLLHDIGKLFCYGASEPGSKQKRHWELGASWAEQMELPYKVIEIIRQHHHPENADFLCEAVNTGGFKKEIGLQNDIYAVCEADKLASGMERRRFNTGEEVFPGAHFALSLVFNNINLGKTSVQDNKMVWGPQNVKEYPYPIRQGTKTRDEFAAFYRKEAERFRDEFERRSDALDERTLLLLLQKYCLNIPEDVSPGNSGVSDISLYYHLRSTASLAYCSYCYISEEKGLNWDREPALGLIKDRKSDAYLLVGGDLSGVQDFVCANASPGALGTARARSFYLELLGETVVSILLEKMDLPRCCLIYSGGGGFFLLAPNTGRVKEALNGTAEEVNGYLYNEHDLRLYLCLDYRPLKGEDFVLKEGGTDLAERWNEIKELLEKQKTQKWRDDLGIIFNDLFTPVLEEKICEICRKPSASETVRISSDEDAINICSFCKKMLELEKKIPGENRICRIQGEDEADINILNRKYVFNPQKKDAIVATYLLDDLWEFAAGDKHVCNFPRGSYYACGDFGELGEKAAGLNCWGVLRMDVDWMDKILSCGLGKRSALARLSELSERFNLYFKYYLPRLLKQKNMKRITHTPPSEPNINLIYAGGDDLLLIGSWNDVLDTAWIIYEDFKNYTGRHSEINLSGGVSITEPSAAFFRMAEEALREERLAKERGRNRLSFFGNILHWDEIAALEQRGEKRNCLEDLTEILIAGGTDANLRPRAFSRSFIMKLMHLIQPIEELDQAESAWAYPGIYYLFARNMENGERHDYSRSFYRPLLGMILQEEVRKRLLPPALQITDYLTRGVRK